MKINNIKYWAMASVLCMGVSSCEDFLNRPTEDNYNVETFYQNDEQCVQGVNYLYNSPWYDFQRGFIKIGEVFSGNMYWGSSPYLNFSVNGTDTDLKNMAYSLWAVNGHANTVYTNLQTANASEAVKISVWVNAWLGKQWPTSTWYVLSVRFPLSTITMQN